jgi:hypothetical protein
VLDVFYLQNGSVWGRSFTAGWQPQRSLNLAGTTAPGAVSSTPGSSDVFVDGAGSSVY